MSEYVSSGNLVTDERTVDIDTQWESQEDWEAYQENNNISIENGVLRLDTSETFDAPESAVYQWPMSEGSGDSISEVINGEDGTINGGIDWVSGDYVGGSALSSPGGDNEYISTGTLGDYCSSLDQGWGVSYTIETTDSDGFILAVVNESGGTKDMLFYVRLVNGSPGYYIRDESDFRNQADAEQEINDGEKHRVFIYSPGINSNAAEFYVDNENVGKEIENETSSTNLVDFDVPVGIFSRNVRGSFDSGISGTLDNIILYTNPDETDVSEDWEAQPWT